MIENAKKTSLRECITRFQIVFSFFLDILNHIVKKSSDSNIKAEISCRNYLQFPGKGNLDKVQISSLTHYAI